MGTVIGWIADFAGTGNLYAPLAADVLISRTEPRLESRAAAEGAGENEKLENRKPQPLWFSGNAALGGVRTLSRD